MEFQVDVAAAPGSGKERQRIRRGGFATLKEAKHERGQILVKGDKASNRRVPNDKATVGEYLARWIDGRRGLRPQTLESYRGHVAKYLIPYLGQITLRDLEDHRISAMFKAIEEENEDIRRSLGTMPRRRRGTYLKAKEVADGARREQRKVIGPASQQRLRATLRKALNDAIKKKYIAGPNPASMVELESGESPPPELWTAETERRWRETGEVPVSTMVWRPEQCGAFLDAAGGDRLYNLILMASQTGMRRGELCGLRWQDVDLDAGRTKIKVQLAAGGEEGPTKTKAGRRTVPLDAALLAMVKTSPNRRRAGCVGGNCGSTAVACSSGRTASSWSPTP